MIKKTIFLLFFIYFLTLLQVSFLSHFSFWGFVPNYVLLFLIFINLFEDSDGKFGLMVALIGGFFMDVFSFHSDYFFGIYMLFFLLVYLVLRFLVRNYVKLPSIKKI